MTTGTQLSIVIPVYNEEENLQELYRRLSIVLKQMNCSYEIVFVDDGSSDRSWLGIQQLHEKDQRVKGLSFSRNFGHMIALCAGLDIALGEAIITMDADLQHPPELIPQLVRKWREGADIINTVRNKTKKESIIKRFLSNGFYYLVNKIAKTNIPRNAADYRLLDRKVVETLKLIRERSRFLRGLIGWVGYKQEFINYEADPRFAGQTKYSFSRMFSFALDGITSFSSFPLRFSTYLGFTIAFCDFIYSLFAIYARYLSNQVISGWTSVLVSVLFIGSVQLIFLGIIGEYLGRVFEETKQRPLYIVNKRI